MGGGSSIFFGGSVVAAVVAGGVSLFAPCCISVMLPAYFSTAVQNRRALVALTFLFAAGVATVILPLAVGAVFLQRLFVAEHELIYTLAGGVLLALSAYVLGGGKLHLPMPGRRAGGRRGPLSAYSLGVFSGVTSSCCAPVLAGVVALSGVAGSFVAAVGLGSAYVVGMVAPLFVISLLWERLGRREIRVFAPRSVTWRIGPVRRTVSVSGLASGILLAVIGAATVYVGLFRDSMPSPKGWEARLAAAVEHVGSRLTHTLSFVPGWVAALLLLVSLALLARRAVRQVLTTPPLASEAAADSSPSEGGRDPAVSRVEGESMYEHAS